MFPAIDTIDIIFTTIEISFIAYRVIIIQDVNTETQRNTLKYGMIK